MPRTAATIFGLALAASAIGFNMTRYPILERILSPPPAEEPAAIAQAKPPDEAIADPADEPEAAPAEVAIEEGQDEPTASTVAEPAPRIAEERIAPAAAEAAEPLPAEPPKPLIAVDMASARSADNTAVRRLPPVSANEAVVRVSGTQSGQVPIYPTTGR